MRGPAEQSAGFFFFGIGRNLWESSHRIFPMRIFLLLLIVCLSFGSSLQAEIYKTIDKNGNVVYTDNPPKEGAEAVKLKEINTLPAERNVTVYQNPSTEMQEGPVNYQIDIISPRNEVVIPPGERDLAVAIGISPELHPDHLVTYYLDGDLIEETRSFSIVIQDVPRGARTLTVEVIDQQGNSLGKSDPLTVNVIRPVVKKN
jgi:hypothetical protein